MINTCCNFQDNHKRNSKIRVTNKLIDGEIKYKNYWIEPKEEEREKEK